MRTTSRNSPPRVALAAFLFALLALVVFFLRAPLGGALWRALGPALAARDALLAPSAAARAELASTTAALAEEGLLRSENTELRAELGRAAGAKLVLAGVLQHPPGTPYDTLVLDAGADLGVAAGDRVVAAGMALGVIDSVTAQTSRVTLFSSPGQTYQAYIAGASALPISFEGQGGGSMRGQLPQGSIVSAGQAVVLPGAAGEMAAKVSAIEAPAGESFITVYARAPFNIFDLRFVYIRL